MQLSRSTPCCVARNAACASSTNAAHAFPAVPPTPPTPPPIPLPVNLPSPAPCLSQYIIKPPESAAAAAPSTAFAWHRDSDWCRTGAAAYQPYLSGERLLYVNVTMPAGIRPGQACTGEQQPSCNCKRQDDAEYYKRHKGAASGSRALPRCRPADRCSACTHPPSPLLPTPRLCVVWCALEDMTLENGCLCVLPGSHLGWTEVAAGQPPALQPLPGAPLEAGGHQSGGSAAVPLEVPARTAIVTTDTLLHCSRSNGSRHVRRSWMPQFSAAPLVSRSSGAPVALALPLGPTAVVAVQPATVERPA